MGANPDHPGGPPGSVPIAADGSVAAFVPARRALSWQTTDPGGEAVVRPVQVQRAVANLLTNAAKFDTSGGPIEVTVGTGPEGARIDVRDHGPGLSPAEREQAFEALVDAGVEALHVVVTGPASKVLGHELGPEWASARGFCDRLPVPDGLRGRLHPYPDSELTAAIASARAAETVTVPVRSSYVFVRSSPRRRSRSPARVSGASSSYATPCSARPKWTRPRPSTT